MDNSDPRTIDTTGIVNDAVAAGRSSNQRWRIATLVLGLVCVLSLALAVFTIVGQRDDAKAGEQDAKQVTQVVGDQATDLADKVLAACAGDSKDARALRAAGLCGQATSTKKQVAQATPGAPGAPGASGSQGLPGIAGQTGPSGRPGIDGSTGAIGATGATGASGATGATGPQGPAGPAGQDGTDGEQGPAGPAGSDGRGISNAQCGDDGRWTITYTDGTISDAGDCRPSILPAPGE